MVQKGVAYGNNSWKSTVKFGRYHSKPPFAVNANNQMQKYCQQYTDKIIASQGLQKYGGVSSVYDIADLQSLIGSVSGNVEALKFYCKNVNLTTVGTNSSNLTARVVIYNVLARNDISSDRSINPLSDWANSYTEEAITNYATAWGSTPFDAGRFGHNWKIYKITTHILAPGESFIHKWYVNPNKFVNAQALGDLSNNGVATASEGSYKHLTHYQLIILQPFPVHDSATNTIVSTGTAGLDLIYVSRYTTYKCVSNPTSFIQTSQFPTSITTQKQVEEVTAASATIVVDP